MLVLRQQFPGEETQSILFLLGSQSSFSFKLKTVRSQSSPASGFAKPSMAPISKVMFSSKASFALTAMIPIIIIVPVIKRSFFHRIIFLCSSSIS